MAFQQALSGLNSASKSLDVIGNNIANANTTGNKMARAEFGALVANSNAGRAETAGGLGVEVAAVSQQFKQGNITITGNNLDLAINGNGFFQMQLENGTTAYSRDGQFQLNKEGFIVSSSGSKLKGFTTDIDGVKTSSTPAPLTLPTGAPIAASATSAVTAVFNLNSADTTVYSSTNSATPLNKYGTSINVFDSQGNAVAFSLAFTRAASTAASGAVPALDNWDVRDASSGNVLTYTDANGATQNYRLQFRANGTLYAPTTKPTITISNSNSTTSPTLSFSLDTTAATLYSTAFAVSALTQDGYTSGTLTGIAINDQGLIKANYSNGQTQFNGMISLANFRNPQGLQPLGGNNWSETFASGEPINGQPDSGQFGSTRAGALEDSNVDLTAELVNMMLTQRTYQANAQTIKTQDQVMQSLINLR
jgi:flagellar hook protein FlgE